MKQTIVLLAGLLFMAGTGLALADATDGGITAAHKKTLKHPQSKSSGHATENKKGKKSVSSHLKNTKYPEYKDGEDGVYRVKKGNQKGENDSSITEYKDGEDGVNRTRPGNHKPGKSVGKFTANKDGEDGVNRVKWTNLKAKNVGDITEHQKEDGEDGVERTRPGNHIPGKLIVGHGKDLQWATWHSRTLNKKTKLNPQFLKNGGKVTANGGVSHGVTKELNPQPLPPGMKPAPGQGQNNGPAVIVK